MKSSKFDPQNVIVMDYYTLAAIEQRFAGGRPVLELALLAYVCVFQLLVLDANSKEGISSFT
jgi:hypothetical protein